MAFLDVQESFGQTNTPVSTIFVSLPANKQEFEYIFERAPSKDDIARVLRIRSELERHPNVYFLKFKEDLKPRDLSFKSINIFIGRTKRGRFYFPNGDLVLLDEIEGQFEERPIVLLSCVAEENPERLPSINPEISYEEALQQITEISGGAPGCVYLFKSQKQIVDNLMQNFNKANAGSDLRLMLWGGAGSTMVVLKRIDLKEKSLTSSRDNGLAMNSLAPKPVSGRENFSVRGEPRKCSMDSIRLSFDLHLKPKPGAESRITQLFKNQAASTVALLALKHKLPEAIGDLEKVFLKLSFHSTCDFDSPMAQLYSRVYEVKFLNKALPLYNNNITLAYDSTRHVLTLTAQDIRAATHNLESFHICDSKTILISLTYPENHEPSIFDLYFNVTRISLKSISTEDEVSFRVYPEHEVTPRENGLRRWALQASDCYSKQ